MSTRRLSHVPYTHRFSPPTHILWGWVRNERKLKVGLHSLYWQVSPQCDSSHVELGNSSHKRLSNILSTQRVFLQCGSYYPRKKQKGEEGLSTFTALRASLLWEPTGDEWKKHLSQKAYQHTLHSETLSSVGNSSGLLRKAFSCSLQSGLHFGTNC